MQSKKRNYGHPTMKHIRLFLVSLIVLSVTPLCQAALVKFEYYGLHPTFFGEENGIEEYGAETIVRFYAELDDIADNTVSQLSQMLFFNFESFTADIITQDIIHSVDLSNLTGTGGIVVERIGNDISVLAGFGLLGETDLGGVIFFDEELYEGNIVYYDDDLEGKMAGVYGTALGSFTVDIIPTSGPSAFLLLMLGAGAILFRLRRSEN